MPSPKSTRQWFLVEKPTDLPVLDGPSPTFKLKSKDLLPLQDDQVLIKTLYLSNDPAQCGWISKDIKPDLLFTDPVEGDYLRGCRVEVFEYQARYECPSCCGLVGICNARRQSSGALTRSPRWSEHYALSRCSRRDRHNRVL